MYFVIIVLIIALDQLMKALIRFHMDLNTTIPLIDGIFHVTYIHNYGAAFSLFENKTFFLIGMQLIVIGAMIIFLAKKHKKENWSFLLSLSMIVAGGLGNLIDRIRFGYVVDFLDFKVWPIFNVADIAVCTGCGLLILYILWLEPKSKKTKNEAESMRTLSGEANEFRK